MIKLSEILLSFSRAISVTLGMGVFHTLQLAKICYIISQHIGLSLEQTEQLIISALLHDIGITSIKKDFFKMSNSHEADLFRKSDLDIFEILDFAKRNKINEIVDLVMAHSLEGAQFLKQSSIKHMIFNIIYKDTKIKPYLQHQPGPEETAYLSKILCIADLLECATTIEETLEQKTIAATKLVKNFSGKFLDENLLKKISNIVKEKEFWFVIVNNRLFIEVFNEFNDKEYSIFSNEALEFFKLFAMFIDIKSPHTAQHSTHTAKISKIVAQQFNLTEDKANLIYQSALVHDVGKLAISNSILEKKGKLTFQEYQSMKQHPKITKKILKPLKNIQNILNWGICHHERLNGSGYPLGLDKDQIPFPSKIIAVADVYDALTADRPYRQGMNKIKAYEIIKKDKNLLFDSDCVDVIEYIAKRE